MKAARKFRFFRMFDSFMVLQRERPIVFSGPADAGCGVTLSFAGRTVEAIADAGGVWHAAFPAMAAGGPYRAELRGGDGLPGIVLHDILVGDVWMCSGQSNMECPLWGDMTYYRSTDGDKAAAEADYPQLRLFNAALARRQSPDQPLDEVDGPGWDRCTPMAAESFSACGFFFGRKLMRDLGVPIGLIGNAWGGSGIEAWISREKYEQEGCREFLEQRDRQAADDRKKSGLNPEFDAWLRRFNDCAKAVEGEVRTWLQPDYDDSGWERGDGIFKIPVPGEKVFRCTFELPPAMAGKELVLTLGRLNDVDVTWLNGVRIGATSTDVPCNWLKRRVYAFPAGVAKAGRNVLAIVNDNHFNVGGFTPEQPVTIAVDGNPEQCVELVWQHANPSGASQPSASRNGQDGSGNAMDSRWSTPVQWCARTAFAADLEKIGVRPDRELRAGDFNLPCTLFNGMMHPWFRYPVRGVIWYQGCHNYGRKDYYVHHRYLIEDWRKQWHDPDLPFFLVQLAGFSECCPENRGPEDRWRHQEPEEEPPFAVTREIQAEMPGLYHDVGMAVAMDAGDQYDIHPGDKKTVGERLACVAERMAYGRQIVSEGPQYDHFTVENGRARVFFKHTDGGLDTSDGQAPGAFALGGKDGKLHWADAKIDGDTVLVSSPEVAEPTRVRYAFAGYRGDCNLVNGAGFPAVPFRSDNPDYSKISVS